MSSKFRWGACSEIGLVRQVNEDSKLVEPPLFAVADGMGGHASGDVASALAVRVLEEELRKSDSISDAVHNANRAIFQKAANDPDLTGMGTTLTAMWADDSSAQIAHVGDSRAYLLRDGQLSRLTQDHTVVNRLVQQGRIMPEDADRHPQRSYLERALGVDPEVEVDVHVLDMAPGDRVLLCSDGLFGMIDDDLIQSVLEQESSPQRAAERLCEEAVHAGGNDNVTTVVVDFPRDRPSGEALTTRNTVAAASSRQRVDTGPLGPGPAATRAPVAAPPPPKPAPPPPAMRSTSSSSSHRNKGPGRVVVWVGLLVVVIGAGVFLARMSIKGSWYVGVDGGRVAVFNGVPGSLAGVELGELRSRTELRAETLPELYQGRLEEGIRANSRSDAGAIVSDLEKLSDEQVEPEPSPTPPPPGEPAPAPPPAENPPA
ncbi:MAG TPA: Stp1/IreP family PP2C-type Ser/Thr phosphatase [Actinomycetota bacterium]|nr:Stp1/IreP family PP2C-type Ser/Thr phosphatase [Actinomycetota bacterium]